MVTAVPPFVAIRLMVLSFNAQNAIDWLSGENTGYHTAVDSLPGIGLAALSDIARRYRRSSAWVANMEKTHASLLAEQTKNPPAN